ncbi:hypothetical protein Psi02_33990 [Planotetraspora silvatica]|uniref:SUKH-3 immunity protein of toxin-antitoxin system n=1 Tax=Planotetraspora silvatica TaxID=234614 RepID=A0A8J3UM64_9ACTN|nr:SUKH-3 domain-containing protein [Planotetraspora silvatica]GII46975.1 hypothetical protein Psi02_33990 [Planotetraspora silvatica]
MTPDEATEVARSCPPVSLPEDVRRVLTAVGWRSDRDVSAWVSTWLRDLYAGIPGSADRLPIHPAARELLDEFGGLSFRQLKQPGSTSGGYDVQVWPTEGRVLVDLFVAFGTDIGVPVFPLAWYEDGPGDIVCAADGRVYLLHEAGEFLIGATPDEAIIRLVRGEPFTPVDDHGEPLRH